MQKEETVTVHLLKKGCNAARTADERESPELIKKKSDTTHPGCRVDQKNSKNTKVRVKDAQQVDVRLWVLRRFPLRFEHQLAEAIPLRRCT